jgi:hypothetical protein
MMHFTSAAAWEAWMAEHYQAEGGDWLAIAKKRSTVWRR